MPATAVAEFGEVVKDYPLGLLRRRKLRAVAGVSVQIEAGEVFGLLGPNRAGKTTLVKMLLSLARPSAGWITRLGRPAEDRSTLARVGYVHENQAFPRYLSARALLEFYGALALQPQEEVQRRSEQLLQLVGLADRGDEPIARFSKGMVQRLGWAQALINDPELLVLDEPAEGLDIPGRKLVHRIVRQQRERGRSALLVSHQTTDVEHLCDRVGVVVGGRLVYVGSPAELVAQSTSQRSLEHALQELYERN